MPSCGCPDIKQADGSVRPCPCKPCSEGQLSECSCNKDTQCACFNKEGSASSCTCGEKCTCPSCDCTSSKTATKDVEAAPKSCCGSQGTQEKKEERQANVEQN